MAEFSNIEIEKKVIRTLFWCKSILLNSASRGKVPLDIFTDKSFRIIMDFILKHFYATGEKLPIELLGSKIEKLKLKGKEEKDVELFREKLMSVKEKVLDKKPISPDVKNFDLYLNELMILHKARCMQKFNMELFNNLDEANLEEAEKLIATFRVPSFSQDIEEAEITENFIEREQYVLERKNNPDKYKLIPTGISELDASLGGGIGKELVIVAGSSNSGKSFFLANAACNARRKGLNVILFTIEMQLLEQQFRCDCNLANIDHSFFRNPVESYSEEVHKKWKAKIEKYKNKAGKLKIVAFKKNAKMSAIVSKVRQIMNEWQEPVDLCCIDYLDDIEPEKDYKEFKHWTSFGEISWDMHLLAKFFSNFDGTIGLPIITANQLKKTSKEVSSNSDFGKKGSKRALDERDTGSSPLPFRHSDIYLGITTMMENVASALVIMKGRFTGKGNSNNPILCFHNFAYGKFHDDTKRVEIMGQREEGTVKEMEELELEKE